MKRYATWTHDEQAEASFQPKQLSSIVYVLLVVTMTGWGIYAFFLRDKYPLPSSWLTILLVLTFAQFVLFSRLNEKAKRAPVLCAKCGKPMAYVEINYPQEEAGGFQETVMGDSGRVYMNVSNGSRGSLIWCRLFRGIRECPTCRRYVVVAPQVLKSIGSRFDMEEAERQSRRADQAIRELQGKKIIFK